MFPVSSTHESNNSDSSSEARRAAGWYMGRELNSVLAVLAARHTAASEGGGPWAQQPVHPPGVPRKVPVVRNHCFWPSVPLFVLVCSLTW